MRPRAGTRRDLGFEPSRVSVLKHWRCQFGLLRPFYFFFSFFISLLVESNHDSESRAGYIKHVFDREESQLHVDKASCIFHNDLELAYVCSR